MSDQCMNCTLRGDLATCRDEACSRHESWYATTLTAELTAAQANNQAWAEGHERDQKKIERLDAKIGEHEGNESGWMSTEAGYREREYSLKQEVARLEAELHQESIFQKGLKPTTIGWQDELEDNYPAQCPFCQAILNQDLECDAPGCIHPWFKDYISERNRPDTVKLINTFVLLSGYSLVMMVIDLKDKLKELEG